MSSVLEDIDQQSPAEISVTTQYQTEDGQPNVALLEDRTPESLQASSSMTLVIAVLGLMFLLLSYFPLWHTDVWGHLSYGRWIVAEGKLPVTEPLMPLSRGVPMVDTAWLSQLIGLFALEEFGTAGLQFLYAASIVFVAGVVAFGVYLRTAQPWLAILAVFMFYWCDYQQLVIVRPQLAGLVCFAAVFAMATSFRWRKWYLWAIPLVFVFWANLHGSFVVGIALLGAFTVGRAIDVWRRSRNLRMVFAETRTRQLLFVTELSAAAVLLNPYGIGIYPSVFAISSHPNLSSLVEWDPLTLRMKQGQAAAVLALSLVAMYRLSPRRVTAGEVLVLLGLGLGAMWTSRLIVWWAPVAAYYFGLHGAAVWRRLVESRPKEPKRGGLYSVAIIGLLWIFFAYSSLGGQVLHGSALTAEEAKLKLERSLSNGTPLEAAEYLLEHPPQGQIFNTYEWGDYLLWAGPEDVQVFVASHIHLIPEEVWQDYQEISQVGPAWSSKLDRYGVNTIVLNPSKHKQLAERLAVESEVWGKVFETNKTVIFERKLPI